MNRSTFFKTLFGLALAPFIPVPKKPTTYKFMSPDVLLGGTSGIATHGRCRPSTERASMGLAKHCQRPAEAARLAE